MYSDPVSGRAITKSAGTSNRRAAERAAMEWEHQLRQHAGQDVTGWEVFRARFEREHLDNLKPSTQTAYRISLDKFESLVGKPSDIGTINSGVMSRFRAKLAGLAPDSIRHHLRNIKSALGWAQRNGIITHTPKYTPPESRGSRGRGLTLLEVIRFLESLRDCSGEYWPGLRQLVMVMWLGGLRFQEALRLSTESGPVQVDLNRDRPLLVFSEGGQKSGKAAHVPVVPDFARWLRRQAPGQIVKSDLQPRTMSDYLKSAGRSAKIQVSQNKHATAHDFRRTFGNRWALRVHPLVLKTLMRHASIETTLRYYVAIDADAVSRQIWDDVHESVHAPRRASVFTD